MLLPMRQIFQEMAAEKLRLGLTILAVAWATLCIAAMLAVGEGIRQGVLRTAQNGNGNLIYLTGGMASIDHGAFHQGKFLTLKIEDVGVVQALPEVKSVAPTARWNEPMTVGDRGSWQQPLAVTTEFAAMTNLAPREGGRWFNPLDQKQMRKVVVLGYSLAADLFNPVEDFSWFAPVTLQVDPVGQKVKIGSEEFTVIGVLKKNSAEIEQGDLINYSSFVPLATWKRFHANGEIGGINVEPQAHANRIQLAQTIRQVIARKHGASVSDEQVVQVDDMFLKQKSMQQFLDWPAKLPWHYWFRHPSGGGCRHCQRDVRHGEALDARHWRAHGRWCHAHRDSFALFGAIVNDHDARRCSGLERDVRAGFGHQRHQSRWQRLL